MSVYLGIDTSNYTTSVAAVDDLGNIVSDRRRVLPVKHGTVGLRQSDALFEHIRAFHNLYEEMLKDIGDNKISSVSVSYAPRNVEDSYMPVFLAGLNFAKVISSSLDVPIYEFSHQEGHIMAALNSVQMPKADSFYAIHLSGGTTELLKVERHANRFNSRIIGATLDINAGQMIDRIGVMCNRSFPCGRELDKLANTTLDTIRYPVNVTDTNVNFSGAESHFKRELEKGTDKAVIARSVFCCVADCLGKMIKNAFDLYGIDNVIVSGGVASNSIIRDRLETEFDNVFFSNPKYATDNAVGIALLGLSGGVK